MSEQEEIKLYDRIRKCIVATQRQLLERKAKLGEKVVIADENGNPLKVSAEEALKLYKSDL